MTTAAVPAGTTIPGPVRVALVDLDAPLADLDCTPAGEQAYERAWVLARRAGAPVGLVDLALPGGATQLPAEALEAALRAELGAAWDRPVAGSPELPLPFASVVVPTNLQRGDQLLVAARSLAAQDHPDFEVVVVDNRRDAGTPHPVLAAVAALPRVRVVPALRPGISAARNAGVAAARGEIVAFTDDDVRADRGWLRAIATRYAADPALDAVSGLVVPAELETPAQLWFEQSGSGLDRAYAPLTFQLEDAGAGALARRRSTVVRRAPGEPARRQSLYAAGEYGLGSNMSLRRAAIDALGGFDEALGAGTPTHGGEDLAMLIELLATGRKLGYEPSAIVHHTHRRGLDELERQISGYGIGFTAMLAAIAWRDPRHLAGLAHMVPAAVRSVAGTSAAKQGRRADYPDALVRLERRGLLDGPAAYVKSRLRQRRWHA